jgi:uncharacterized protein with HEPN domain
LPRDSLARVQDMLGAIDRIQTHLGSMTFEEFSVSATVAAAISYELLVLGEAAGRVSADLVAAHPEIPWNQLRGTRNVLVHGYFEISRPTLWETVQRDLPALVIQLRRLLA